MVLLFVILGVFAAGAASTIVVLRSRPRKPIERDLPDGADGWLSTDLLMEVSNPKRLNTIRQTSRGQARLDVVIQESKSNGGPTGFVTICVDPRGIIALKDGHHRLLFAREKGLDRLPVAIRQSKGIRSHGKHISEILPLMLIDPVPVKKKLAGPSESGHTRRSR